MKQCPFCASDDVGYGYNTHPNGHELVMISCSNCGASGPARTYASEWDDDEAEASWDKRHNSMSRAPKSAPDIEHCSISRPSKSPEYGLLPCLRWLHGLLNVYPYSGRLVDWVFGRRPHSTLPQSRHAHQRVNEPKRAIQPCTTASVGQRTNTRSASPHTHAGRSC